MYWANFLHIYQPPTQKEIWVRRIADESYRKVFSGIAQIPRAKVTLNMNGVLCELLARYGGADVLRMIRELIRKGAVELTGSAKYHAFLPFLPESEIERQARLNEASLDAHFGDDWRKNGKGGFFSPEMAYSATVAAVAARLGYRWIIADELAFPAHHRKSHETVYTVAGLGNFGVFFRERNLSFAILSSRGAGAAPTILRYLGDRLGRNEYALTAMDGETFGHHRPGLETLLFDLLAAPEITPVTVSDLVAAFGKREAIEPRESTWAASKNDMRDNTPYARWRRDDNRVQQCQWELTELAITVVGRAPEHAESRKLLDEALHSDQYWWASARPWWSLEMIERGAHELKTVIETSPAATAVERSRAEDLYREILYTGFDWQRSGLVDEISRQENEEVAERLEEKEKLFITKDEYRQMIRVLEEQMHLAAQSEEYHRAAMIKDRIRELKEEMEKAKQ